MNEQRRIKKMKMFKMLRVSTAFFLFVSSFSFPGFSAQPVTSPVSVIKARVYSKPTISPEQRQALEQLINDKITLAKQMLAGTQKKRGGLNPDQAADQAKAKFDQFVNDFQIFKAAPSNNPQNVTVSRFRDVINFEYAKYFGDDLKKLNDSLRTQYATYEKNKTIQLKKYENTLNTWLDNLNADLKLSKNIRSLSSLDALSRKVTNSKTPSFLPKPLQDPLKGLMNYAEMLHRIVKNGLLRGLPDYPSSFDGTQQVIDVPEYDSAGKLIRNLRWEFSNVINWDSDSGVDGINNRSDTVFMKVRNTDPVTGVTQVTATFLQGRQRWIQYSTELLLADGSIGVASNLSKDFTDRSGISTYSSRRDLGNGAFGIAQYLDRTFNMTATSRFITLKNLGDGALGLGENLKSDFSPRPGISRYYIKKNFGDGAIGIANVGPDFADIPGVSIYNIQQVLRDGKIGIVLNLGPGFVTTSATNYLTQKTNPDGSIEIAENLSPNFSDILGTSKYTKQRFVIGNNSQVVQLAVELNSNFNYVPGHSEYVTVTQSFRDSIGTRKIARNLNSDFSENPGVSRFMTVKYVANGILGVAFNLDDNFSVTSATIYSTRKTMPDGTIQAASPVDAAFNVTANTSYTTEKVDSIVDLNKPSLDSSKEMHLFPSATLVTVITVKDLLHDGAVVESWEIGAGKDGRTYTPDDEVIKHEDKTG